MMRNLRLHLYDEPILKNFQIESLREYLFQKTGLEAQIRPDFLAFVSKNTSAKPKLIGEVARKWAESKIRDLNSEVPKDFPLLKGEVDYEKRRLEESSNKTFGLLYDGFKLSHFFSRFLPKNERNFSHLHLIFTNQLIGTWDFKDHRYHARVAIFSFPSFISLSGVVEAPAKPAEYYLVKRATPDEMRELALAEWKASHKPKFIDFDDERLTEVLKGYLMQAVSYHLTGEPFCSDQHCRLFNAHFQEDLIQAQLQGKYEFCPKHQRFFGQLKQKVNKL